MTSFLLGVVASLVEVEPTSYMHSIFRLEIAMWDEGGI